MEKLTLDVAQLDLDIENPRIKAEDNQTEAMKSLLAVERSGDKVYELARNICAAGMLDPGDRLYVIKQRNTAGRYIVLEGNRRLTALRLLSQPGMIDRDDIGLSIGMRSKFRRLQSEYKDKWPTTVDVVVFDDRESANHFIRLRHTGENSGAGRSAWSALQVARFDNTGLWQSLEFLRHEAALELDVVNALDTSSFNITNYDRVSGTQEFQRRFGVAIGKFTFKIGDDRERARYALTRLASDVVSGRVDSRGEFTEAKGMLAYLLELEDYVSAKTKPPLASDDQPSQTQTSSPVTEPASPNVTPIRPSAQPNSTGNGSSSPWDGEEDGANTEAPPASPAQMGGDAATATVKPIRKPRTSKYLIDKKDLLTVTNQKCRTIVDELKTKVEVQKAPFACALLLRSLLELTAEIYLVTMGVKAADRAARIDAAANDLLAKSHTTDTSNKQELALAFKKSRDAYDELSAAAHHSVVMVSPEHVRSTWSNLRGGMDLLWRRIHAEEHAKKKAAAVA